MLSRALVLLTAASLLQRSVVESQEQLFIAAAIGGWSPVLTAYPWTVAVYKADKDNKTVFNHICGGSLIGLDVVLSAAHCFWNGGNDIQLDEYKITVGNNYRDITSPEHKQICKVNNIKIHERYRDIQLSYAHDIAIVWLKEKVDISLPLVKPIAIEWNNDFEDLQLKGQSGTVVGWGYTDDNKPSEQRVAVQLPYIDFDTCWKTVPQAFRPFVTPDKFCAGHRNGTAVCPGDSGGGLAFFHPTSRTWYLRGIVSVGVTPEGEDNCFKTQYSAFTSIASNYLWLRKQLNEARLPIQNVPIVFPMNNS